MDFATMRIVILLVGWLILIIGSIYIFIKGKKVYDLIKGSLIGKVTKTLVLTMLLEMYSLGVVCTAYMFTEKRSFYLILPIFIIWFASFIATIKMVKLAQAETKKLVENDNQ